MFKKKTATVVETNDVEAVIDWNDPSLFEFQIADDTASEHIAAPKYSYWGSVFRRFFSNKLAILMLVIALTVVLFAFIQPMISGFDAMVSPNINNKAMHYIRPFKLAGYPFGTDDMGNSLFDALWSGTRNSLIVAIAATLITEFVGIVIGMFWGFSKSVDVVMIEVYNVLSNIPTTLSRGWSRTSTSSAATSSSPPSSTLPRTIPSLRARARQASLRPACATGPARSISPEDSGSTIRPARSTRPAGTTSPPPTSRP